MGAPKECGTVARSVNRRFRREVEEFRKRVQAVWDLSTDPRAAELLQLACEARQRILELRELLAKTGYLVPTRSGTLRANPLLQQLRQSEQTFLQCVRELGLED